MAADHASPPVPGREPAGQRLAAYIRTLIRRSGAQGLADLLFVPVVTVLLVVYFATQNEFFLTELNVTNIFTQAAILAIVAFGVTFVILAGELDLSVGSGVALASVLCAFVMRDTESILLGVLVAIAAGLTVGLVNGLIVTRLNVPSFIATFGMLVIASGIALSLTDGGVVSGLPLQLGDIAREGFLGIRWIIWLTIAVFIALYYVQTQTAFGVRVFAVGGNRQAANLAGINVNRVRLLVFVVSGLAVGIAGFALTARLESGQPNAGTLLELDAIAAIVIGGTSIFGGRGSLSRTLWGVMLIAVLQNGLDLEGVGDDLKQIIIGGVLITAASADFVRRRLAARRAEREEDTVSAVPAGGATT
jgi:ribose/xylose/arabinose/galactoside ABC-type transport system permease subunit